MPSNRERFRLASGELAKVEYTQQPTQVNQPVQERTGSLLEQAAGGLLALTGKVGELRMQDEAEKAYIEGVRTVSAGRKVEDIEANPLVKPFLRGGGNDQTYRAKLVEAEREVQEYIRSEGREYDPDDPKWQSYLTGKFDGIYQEYGKRLTASQRSNLTDLGLRLEENLRAVHADERTKYIWETTAASIGALANLTQHRLDRVGRGAYDVGNEAVDLVQQVTTTALPEDQQRELLLMLANNMGVSGHPELTQELLQHPLVREADPDTQTKAEEIIEAAFSKTELRDSIDDMALYARMEAGVKAGVYGEREIRAFHDEVTSRRSHIRGPAIQRLWQLHMSTPPTNDLANHGNMWLRGRAGVEEATAAAVEREDLRRGANYQYVQLKAESISDAVTTTLQVAATNGIYPVDFIGDVERGVQVFLESDALGPSQAQIIEPFITYTKGLHEDGRDGEVMQVLSHLDSDTQNILYSVIRSKNTNTEDAMRIARDTIADNANSTRAMAAQNVDLTALIRERAPDPFWFTHSLGLRRTAPHQKSPEFDNIFVTEVERRARKHLPFKTQKDAVDIAINEVRNNTMVIKNKSGLTTLPLQFTDAGVAPFLQAVQSYADTAEVPKIVTAENLGPAIAKVYPGGKGLVQAFNYTGQSLRMWETNSKGEIITNAQEVDAQKVYEAIEAAEAADSVRNYGRGVANALMHPLDVRQVTGVDSAQTIEGGADAEGRETIHEITANAEREVRGVVGDAIIKQLISRGDLDIPYETYQGVREAQPISGHEIVQQLQEWARTGKVPEAVSASIILAEELDGRNPAYRAQERRDRADRAAKHLPSVQSTTPFQVYDGSQPEGQRPLMDVYVDGTNTSNLPHDIVVAWRHDLLQYEGFRSKDYVDARGRSVGFGHFLGNGTHARGVEWSLEQATEQFVKDTDEALSSAGRLAQELGLEDNVSAQLFLASMVFQMGASSTRKFKQTFKRLQNYDVVRYDEFLRELRDSDWYSQTPDRVDGVAGYVRHLFYEDN